MTIGSGARLQFHTDKKQGQQLFFVWSDNHTVRPAALEAEDMDYIIYQLQQEGYITKVEGVIIHLSKEKLL